MPAPHLPSIVCGWALLIRNTCTASDAEEQGLYKSHQMTCGGSGSYYTQVPEAVTAEAAAAHPAANRSANSEGWTGQQGQRRLCRTSSAS